MKSTSILLALLVLALFRTATATDTPLADIVEGALNGVEWNFETSWAFDETSHEDGRTVVGRYDPSLPVEDRWQLLGIDGRPPTAEETEDYVSSKDFEHLDVGDNDGGNGLHELIRPGSLRLLDQNERYWNIGFDPQFDADDEDEQFLNSLTGLLRISRKTGALALMDMRNERPLRPIVGAKINKMVMRFEFGPTVTDGPTVLKVVDVIVRGSALVFVRFDEHERYEFSNFVRVGAR